MNNSSRYFYIAQGKLFPCFCEACLIGKSGPEMSPNDTMYCQECQTSIMKEKDGKKFKII